MTLSTLHRSATLKEILETSIGTSVIRKKDNQGIPPLKRRGGPGITASEIEHAEEFNGQFTDVFNKSYHSKVLFLSRSAPFMDDIVVSNDYVTKFLQGLNPSKALGPDELPHRVLKELATELVQFFAHLFQKSLDTGEIPKEWSLANICPLYKKGDRTLASNYRPVSLTCVPCKLLEHIVCSNIMAHLDEYKLFSDRQHAFRKRHSCETQLTTVINDWAKTLDNGGQVDIFILDFEKASDTPPHELLKSKLFGFGIGGKTLKWIDFSVLQKSASCCKRSKIGFGPSFVWCPTGHCPWSLVVFCVH